MLKQLMKNCSPWEEPTLEKLMENCLLWEILMLEHGKSVRSLPLEKKGAAETMCGELSSTPISCLPVLLWVGDREIRSEVETRKEGGGQGNVLLRLIFLSHCHTLI